MWSPITKSEHNEHKPKLMTVIGSRFILPLITVAVLTYINANLLSVLPQYLFLLYILAVFLHSWFSGFRAGMTAAIASAFAVQFFLEPPFYTLKLDKPQVLIGSVFFILEGLIIAYFAGGHVRTIKRMGDVLERLSLGERKLRDTIDSVFAIIVIVSTTGRVLEANRAFASLFPEKWDGITGKSVTDLPVWGSEETRAKIQTAVNEAANGTASSFDDFIVRDIPMNIELSFAPVFKHETDIVEYIIISGIDITTRKEYEQDLEKVQENYLKLVNSNVIGMIINDGTGKIIEANDAFLRTISYSNEDFLKYGLTWQEISTLDSAERDLEAFEQIKERGVIGPMQKELINKKTGKLVPIVLNALLIDDDNYKMLCLIIDISEQKELERKKDEFLSIASHELKTPLTTLKGYAQLLNKRLQERSEENMKYMNVVERQTNKLTELIDDLLDISRIQSGKLTMQKKPVDLVELIEETVRDIQLLSQQHTISFMHDLPQVVVQADRFRIIQVVTNFLTNAIKYSSNADKVNVYLKVEDNRAVVTVEDFGNGLEPEFLEKIFDKFFQAEPDNTLSTQSLGLGLYISAEIIRQHDGDIWAESVPGAGSKFSFALKLD